MSRSRFNRGRGYQQRYQQRERLAGSARPAISSAMGEILDLKNLGNWPSNVREALRQNRTAIVSRGANDFSGPRYDAAIYALAAALAEHSLIGFHCTRLADHEVGTLRQGGMVPLSPALVEQRIDDAVRNGLVTSAQAARLKAKNQAGEKYRAGMIWFCFFEPHETGEHGISDLLRYWGGESLYNSHDRDAELGPLISSIGRPAIVEAEVPIAWLGGDGGVALALNVASHYALVEGANIEAGLYEDNIKQPLPGNLVRAIHLHPSAEFARLAGLVDWQHPL